MRERDKNGTERGSVLYMVNSRGKRRINFCLKVGIPIQEENEVLWTPKTPREWVSPLHPTRDSVATL